MDIIRNLYLHKYSHKMFYKTKSTSRRASSSATVTEPTDGLSKLIHSECDLMRRERESAEGSQQFYIYTIEGRSNTPNTHLDLPPKYEDVIKDPNYVRREVSSSS